MTRVVFLIFCSGFTLTAFRSVPDISPSYSAGIFVFGESTPRQTGNSDGELYAERAGIFASAAWPRRDRIKPEKPFAVKLNADTSFIYLNWEANHESDLKGYRVYRSTEDNPGKFRLLTRKAVKSCSFSELHPGAPGMRFVYQVTAVDRAGNESEYVTLSVIIPDKLRPSSPVVEDISYRKGLVFIRWKPNTEKDLKGYWIYRQKDSLSDRFPLNKTLMPPGTVLYLDRNIEGNSSYTYYVVAVDSTGLQSEKSNSIQVNTMMAESLGDIITGLRAGYDSLKKSVTLSFRCAADSHYIKGFVILRSSDHNNYYPVSTLLKTPLFSDTALEKGSAYYYKVNVLTTEGKTIEGRTVIKVMAD